MSAQTAGRIAGRILDSSHAAVPGAIVRAENEAFGQSRVAVTDGGGFYVIADLAIGTYAIRVEKPGFRSAIQSRVQVGVADAVTANLVLTPGDQHETIDVAAAATADSAPGAGFSFRQIQDLPTDGRDFARFSLLSAGAVPRSGSMADLPFNGLTIVLNSYTIDGVDASRVDLPYLTNAAERGARLLTGSLETVAEFRVQTSNFDAQYGGAASAYVNIATRGGTNQFHGSLFEYLRNDFFDARNFFNTGPAAQAEFRYSGFGANAGGPLARNRSFFFANYEGSRQRVGITGSGTTPSPLLRGRVSAASPALAPIVAEFPNGSGATADPLVDRYSTVSVSRVREDTGSVRLDHNFNSRDSGFARVNVNDSHVIGPLFAIAPSALGLLDFQDVPVRTANAVVHEQHVFETHLITETFVGLERVAAQYNSAAPYPTVSVAGISIAPGGNGNQKTNSTAYQIRGSASYATGAHLWRWGARAERLQNDLHTSDFSRLLYASLNDFVSNSIASASVMPGIPGRSVRGYRIGAYAQDSWRVGPALTLDLGLRYDYEPPIFDPAHLGRVFDFRAHGLSPPGASYYRGNPRDFSPRIAVAWRPDASWTLRAGYGIFFEPYPPGYTSLSIPRNSLPLNTTLLRQQIPDLAYPIIPFLARGLAVPPTVTGFDWAGEDTYAQQWSCVAERRLTADLAWQTAYVGNHALNLHRRYDVNLYDPALKQRPDPNFADILIEATDAQSLYHGLQTSLVERFRGGIVFAVHYTWSHSIDNAGDDNVASSQPQDVNNFMAERGNGSSDARHVGSFDFVYELPFGRGKRFLAGARGFEGRLISGWRVSGVGLARSGVPATVTIPISQTGNGATTNQRPDAVGGISPYPIRLNASGWLNSDAFVLPAPGRFGNLGRNTVYGPKLSQLDLTAAKNTPLTAGTNLEFRVETFNLPNHPNFAQPVTTLGSVAFGNILNTLGRTLGMGCSRQVQVALRLHF